MGNDKGQPLKKGKRPHFNVPSQSPVVFLEIPDRAVPGPLTLLREEAARDLASITVVPHANATEAMIGAGLVGAPAGFCVFLFAAFHGRFILQS
jgi:hypothetical protein